jgi:4,4'-diaponeurosporenoate glycosyltransferase
MDPLALSLVVRWGIGWGLWLHMPLLPTLELQGQPRVSVLIPARNEQATLPHLLRAMQQQRLRPLEVIVIDDHSTDQTAAIARTAGVRLIEAPPLPAGWCGKTWALHHGSHQAQGDLLVFLDADTEPVPTSSCIWWPCTSSWGAWFPCSRFIAPRNPMSSFRCCSIWWA